MNFQESLQNIIKEGEIIDILSPQAAVVVIFPKERNKLDEAQHLLEKVEGAFSIISWTIDDQSYYGVFVDLGEQQKVEELEETNEEETNEYDNTFLFNLLAEIKDSMGEKILNELIERTQNRIKNL